MRKMTVHLEENNKMFYRASVILKALVICLGLSLFAAPVVMAAAQEQARFASAEKAASGLVAALKVDDTVALKSVLGREGSELISSGDAVADKNGRQKFLQLFEEKNRIVFEGSDKAILEIGRDNWPFPIPLVKDKAGWYLDTKSGKEEILNRRIGRNEIDTIQTLLAVVDAQREYAMKDYNKDGVVEYAEKFKSEPGKKDGLYWESSDPKEQSPLGPLVAIARQEHYVLKASKENPQPYHGYFFKMLKKQGANARGGAFDYLVKGRMIGGFAVVSYPAQYGNSGVMTFLVNHDGVVYQKDLGPGTAKIVKGMDSYNPDKTWKQVSKK